jgi:hypothetical protein
MPETIQTLAKIRKIRRDKRAPGVKMTLHLTVKLRPGSRSLLKSQASQAGFKSSARYLRDLAKKDRVRLQLPPYDFNDFESAPPAPNPS